MRARHTTPKSAWIANVCAQYAEGNPRGTLKIRQTHQAERSVQRHGGLGWYLKHVRR